MELKNNSGIGSSAKKPRQVINDPDSYMPASADFLGQSDNYWKLIENWPYESQVWTLKYGGVIAGLLAGVGGFYINQCLRKFLVLEHLGFVSTLGSGLVPLAATYFVHTHAVTEDIMKRVTPCPVCVQTRATAVQIGLGVIYPTVLSYALVFGVASSMKSEFRIPSLTKNPIGVYKYAKYIFKPIQRKFFIAAGIQMTIASGLTYLQQESYYTNVMPYLVGTRDFKTMMQNNNDLPFEPAVN